MPAAPHAPALRYLALLGRAAARVDAQLDTAIDAAALARHAAMSRHHFHRLFHAHFGMTVGGYLTWRRLQRACEQLAATQAPVLDVALAVGFGSAQALAKAMRRELRLTPTQVRRGTAPDWAGWFAGQRIPEAPASPRDSQAMLQPRWTTAPDLMALAASGRGMRDGHMAEAARQGFGTLIPALQDAGLMSQVTHCVALLTSEPRGPNDPACEMLTGALFGHDLHAGRGAPAQPDLRLREGLRWWPLPGGRYAVFTHVGPYTGLHGLWTAIYRHWLPATGQRLRDAPGFDLYIDDPRSTPPERLRTALYLPVE